MPRKSETVAIGIHIRECYEDRCASIEFLVVLLLLWLDFLVRCSFFIMDIYMLHLFRATLGSAPCLYIF